MHVTHSTIGDVLNVLRMKNISVTAGLTAIGGNSYHLRRRAARAHVCASDNTICTLRAECLAGRRRHTRRRSVCPGAVYLISGRKYAGKELDRAPRLQNPGELGALREYQKHKVVGGRAQCDFSGRDGRDGHIRPQRHLHC